MNEMPENLSDEEKEAWEKSVTAGSLPTWWKPKPEEPAAAAAPAPPAPAPATPAAQEPLVQNAPPDWEHSRTAGSLPTWWKPGDPPPAPPVRDPEQTLQLERSEMEAATAPPIAPAAAAPPAPPAPPDLVDRDQRTMVLGTFPAAARVASVMVRSGPDTGAKFALESSPLYVGRAPDNGIVVNDPATSRRHARFEQRDQDFLVVDLGSANGTLVDGVRVVEKILTRGAVITMGQNEFVVSIQPEHA